MRVESLSSRLDFDERRARSLEGVVQYRPPARRAVRAPPVEPNAAEAGGCGRDGSRLDAPASGVGERVPGRPRAAAETGTAASGERRRRRRRRRRQPVGTMADGAGQPTWSREPPSRRPARTGAATAAGGRPTAPDDDDGPDEDGPDADAHEPVKLAVVVQRYGADISGGAELHARYIAERLARHAEVEVLTTCARDYVTWRNEFPAGEETRSTAVTVRRFPVEPSPERRTSSARSSTTGVRAAALDR